MAFSYLDRLNQLLFCVSRLFDMSVSCYLLFPQYFFFSLFLLYWRAPFVSALNIIVAILVAVACLNSLVLKEQRETNDTKTTNLSRINCSTNITKIVKHNKAKCDNVISILQHCTSADKRYSQNAKGGPFAKLSKLAIRGQTFLG